MAVVLFQMFSGCSQKVSIKENVAKEENKIVLDKKKAIAWMKCTAGLQGNKCEKGKALRLTWKESFDYCSSLKLSGRKWRLPTQGELMSIRISGKPAPTIDEVTFPGTVSDTYWGSKNKYGGIDHVNFEYGSVGSYSPNTQRKKFVRCVSE